jgi:hypothetical protein
MCKNMGDLAFLSWRFSIKCFSMLLIFSVITATFGAPS